MRTLQGYRNFARAYLKSMHLGHKKSLRRNDFFSQFWRGGIGTFESQKPGSKCGESNPVDIRKTFSEGGIQYPYPLGIAAKSDCGATALCSKMATSHPSQAIDTHSRYGIIQESKNADADQAAA